jgi:hypothetical protein
MRDTEGYRRFFVFNIPLAHHRTRRVEELHFFLYHLPSRSKVGGVINMSDVSFFVSSSFPFCLCFVTVSFFLLLSQFQSFFFYFCIKACVYPQRRQIKVQLASSEMILQHFSTKPMLPLFEYIPSFFAESLG